MKITTKSIIMGRLPRGKNEFSTVFVKCFDENDPHLKEIFPKEEHKFDNVAEIKFDGLNMSYFTEGKDIVINNLEDLDIEKKDTVLVIKGKQK